MRRGLNAVATVDTNRYTIDQQFLDHFMPRYLGTPLDTRPSSWQTSHGDLHWANLCGPELCILDWEGWGLGPTGYDAAMLHSYSLLDPALSRLVRHELADTLNTAEGQFAELVTITELLLSADLGGTMALVKSLRRRASEILGREIPRYDSSPRRRSEVVYSECR